MFKFLRDKLKKAISKFSKGVDEQADDVEVEEKTESPKEDPKPIVEEKVSEPEAEPEKEPEAEPIPVKEEPAPVPEPKEEEPTPEPEPKDEEPVPEIVKEETIQEPELVEERKVPEPERVIEEPETVKEEPVPETIEEESVPETEIEEEKQGEPAKDLPEIEEPKKKGFFAKIKDKIIHHEEKVIEEKQPEPQLEPSPEPEPPKVEITPEPVKEEHAPETVEEETPEPQPEPVKEQEKTSEPEHPKPIVEEGPKKKGLFGFITEKITKKSLSEEKFNQLFFELEMALLENNVAVEVIDKIKDDLKGKIVGRPLPRGKIEEIIIGSLIESIRSLFSEEEFDLLKKGESKKPYVICFFGINGSGKTTSIAKVAHMLLQANKSVVLAAADTFRAAAIDQLQLHADRLGIKLIKHDYGADAAAVAFDAVKHGEAKGADFVLIDTAGRMHSNVNLQDELKKIVRVSKPDLKVFVGEAITGNDCVEQAVQFNKTVGIDAIILTKADVDEKGGAFVSVSYVTKKPIAFIGTGQEYGDLKPFSKKIVMENLGLA